MRAVVQRVTESKVIVNGEPVGEIRAGLLVLLGVEAGDTEKDSEYLVNKVIGLRVFEDDEGKMNRGLIESGGELLVVSQFTLLGDVRKGKRPSFVKAASPDEGKRLYEDFVTRAKNARGSSADRPISSRHEGSPHQRRPRHNFVGQPKNVLSLIVSQQAFAKVGHAIACQKSREGHMTLSKDHKASG